MDRHSEALKTLGLFNEKADELLASRFYDGVGGGGALVEFKEDVGWDSIFVGLDEESTKALVLTLRLFMQDNERISLANMKRLFDSLRLSDEVIHEFEAWRTALNEFLNSDARLAIEEERQLTHRDILDIFVYGGYAHLNKVKRQTYEDLRATAVFPLFQSRFVDVMIVFGRCISGLRQVNERAVAELRPKQ